MEKQHAASRARVAESVNTSTTWWGTGDWGYHWSQIMNHKTNGTVPSLDLLQPLTRLYPTTVSRVSPRQLSDFVRIKWQEGARCRTTRQLQPVPFCCVTSNSRALRSNKAKARQRVVCSKALSIHQTAGAYAARARRLLRDVVWHCPTLIRSE